MTSYKEVMYLIPERILDKYDTEDANFTGHDGDLHNAASDYICELQKEIVDLKNQKKVYVVLEGAWSTGHPGFVLATKCRATAQATVSSNSNYYIVETVLVDSKE